MDLLEWVAQAMPGAMDALPNTDFVNLVIVFLGSPAYVKNAHLRAKLVDVGANYQTLGSCSNAGASLLPYAHAVMHDR